jgi:hypothetical protein
MNDLTAELRLRGLEPPYDAVKQELATRFGRISEVAQKKAGREFARQIGMFRRENDKPLRPGGGKFNKLPGARVAAATLSASFDTRGIKTGKMRTPQ